MAHGKKGIWDGLGPQTFAAADAMFCRATEGASMNLASFVGTFDTGALSIAIDIEVDTILGVGIVVGDELLVRDLRV